MRESVYSATRGVLGLASGTISTDTATNGATVDLETGGSNHFRSVKWTVVSGTVTDGEYVLSVQDSDNGTDWAAADAQYVHGGGTFVAADDNAVKEIGYNGPKRFARVVLTSTDVETGGSFSAVANLGGASTPVVR